MSVATDRRWLVLVVLCIAVFLIVVDNTIVNVALPSLSRDLRASDSSLQWIVDGYSLPFAAFLLAGGALSDRLGRKRIIMVGLVAFAVFSFMASSAHSVTSLVTARALMGASAALIFPATLSSVTVVFSDPTERAKAFGVWGATTGVAIALGPVAGGLLLDHFWYGSIFLVNVPLAIVGLFFIGVFVPESSSPARGRFDFAGLILGTLGVGALVLGIIQGPSWGWVTAKTLGLFAAAAVIGWLFVRWELGRDEPMMDVRIFASRVFSTGAGAIAVNFFCLFGFIFLFTQYFQLILGHSALSAGVHTTPFAAMIIVATPVAATAALRFGTRAIVTLGLVIIGFALMWMATLSAHAAYLGPVVGSMLTFALGFSLVNAPATAAVMATLSRNQVGSGAAGNETTRELGGTLGVAVIGSVFASSFGPDVRRSLEPLTSRGLTRAQIDAAQSSMQAARAVVAHLAPSAQARVGTDMTSAFMQGLHRGCLVGAGVAVVSGAVVFASLPARNAAHVSALALEG